MDEGNDIDPKREAPVSSDKPRLRSSKPPTPNEAFDIWLRRGLHAMFDEVAREPIPEELLRLIEADRRK